MIAKQLLFFIFLKTVFKIDLENRFQKLKIKTHSNRPLMSS